MHRIERNSVQCLLVSIFKEESSMNTQSPPAAVFLGSSKIPLSSEKYLICIKMQQKYGKVRPWFVVRVRIKLSSLPENMPCSRSPMPSSIKTGIFSVYTVFFEDM